LQITLVTQLQVKVHLWTPEVQESWNLGLTLQSRPLLCPSAAPSLRGVAEGSLFLEITTQTRITPLWDKMPPRWDWKGEKKMRTWPQRFQGGRSEPGTASWEQGTRERDVTPRLPVSRGQLAKCHCLGEPGVTGGGLTGEGEVSIEKGPTQIPSTKVDKNFAVIR